jgi:hypothetical protein
MALLLVYKAEMSWICINGVQKYLTSTLILPGRELRAHLSQSVGPPRSNADRSCPCGASMIPNPVSRRGRGGSSAGFERSGAALA